MVEALLAAQAKAHSQNPVSRLGLSPGCGSWLGGGVVLLYCGPKLSGSSIEPRGASPALRISGSGMTAGSLGDVMQAVGRPLLPGGQVRLHSLRAARGELVAVAASQPDGLRYVRFTVDFPAGTSAILRYTSGTDPAVVVERPGVPPQRPDRLLTVNSPALPRPPAPDSADIYQDCSTVGPTQSVTDPIGDVLANVGRGIVDGFPGVDLTSVAAARSGSVLCVDFHTHAAPTAGDNFIFDLRGVRPRGMTGTALVGINVGLGPGGRRIVTLNYPGDDESSNLGYVKALVGVSGSSVSLLIDRTQLPSFAPFDVFRWDAVGIAQDGPTVQVSDQAPDGAGPLYRVAAR